MMDINLADINNIWILIISSIMGTLFAFTQKWAWSEQSLNGTLFKYLFGNGRAVARSLTKLVGALSVAITVDMQSGMSVMQIIVLGVGIGLATPEKVDQEQQKKQENNSVVK